MYATCNIKLFIHQYYGSSQFRNTENKPKANESDKKAAEEKEEELDPVKLVTVSHKI